MNVFLHCSNSSIAGMWSPKQSWIEETVFTNAYFWMSGDVSVSSLTGEVAQWRQFPDNHTWQVSRECLSTLLKQFNMTIMCNLQIAHANIADHGEQVIKYRSSSVQYLQDVCRVLIVPNTYEFSNSASLSFLLFFLNYVQEYNRQLKNISHINYFAL